MKIRLPIRKPAVPRPRPSKLILKASVARSRRAPIVEDEDDFLEEPEPNMKLSHAFVVVLVLHVIAVAGVFAFNSIKTRQADIFAANGDAAATANAQSANEPIPPATGAGDPSNGAVSPPPAEPAAAPATAAASPTPASAPATAAASGKTHEMQPGDTLTKIAAQYGVTIAALQQVNNITDPKKLRAGTVLSIPEGGNPAPAAVTIAQPSAPTATPTAESTAAAAKIKDTGEVYTVVKGDNPVKIAKKLHVPYAELMTLNGNPDPKKLQIGQKFKIPASTTKKP